MEKKSLGFIITLSLILALGVASFALCIVAELKKIKKKDLKLNGRLCYLPRSEAFGFGISALICLSIAHIIGNLIICQGFCSEGKRRSCYEKRSAVMLVFLSISWISFIIAVVLISASTSMNTRQSYGNGWLDGDCYIVKDGVFFGAGLLVLVSVGSTIVSVFVRKRVTKVEQPRKDQHVQI